MYQLVEDVDIDPQTKGDLDTAIDDLTAMCRRQQNPFIQARLKEAIIDLTDRRNRLYRGITVRRSNAA